MNYLYIGLLKMTVLGLIEVSEINSNYRRIEMGPSDWFFLDEDKKDFITNAVEIRFPEAINSWGTVTHFGVFDSLNEGNLLITGNLNDLAFVIFSGSTVKFDAGSLKILIDQFKIIGNKNGR